MQKPIRILHLEDNPVDAELIHAKLESEKISCDIVRVKDREDFESTIVQGVFDLILSDYSVPRYNGFAALKYARQKYPDLPFILVSGTLGEEQAVDSLKSGATDYIVKQRLERLGPAVNRAMIEVQERKEHERIERQLRLEAEASEIRFRTLVEQALVGIYVVQDDRFIYANPSMGKILRYTVEEIISRPLHDFIFPEDRPMVLENIRKRIEGIVSETHYTLRMLRRNQSVAFVEARGGRIDDFNGRPAIIGTLLDITERIKAEEKLREQAALLDKAQDAICLNDMSQQILYWNKSAERLYGWTAEEAIGKNANDLLFQGDLAAPMEAIVNLIRHGEWKGELDQITKSRQKLVIESRWTLMRDDQGKPKSILVINTDITEKKQTEAKLLRTQRMESIGALAGGIAHDLNNSLAPILMAADMIRDDLPTEESRKLLDTMKNSAQRGADMVRQILSFSRGLTGEHAAVQLKHLVADMEKFAKSTFPRSIQVETQITGSLLPVLGDATQIHQVLMNLCINARDAMPDGGRLLIHASNIELNRAHSKKQVDGPHIVLAVTDSGHGMPSEIMDKIFEPFFTTKAVGKGTGLGLSTVVEIVKSHRGFIDVSSQPGKGTTFQVFLPAIADSQPVEAPAHAAPPGGTGQLILLVDDETAILEMTKLMLEAHNYHVLTAKDGIEAIDLFSKQFAEIDVVVTDMMMPTMNGPELIKNLRKIDAGVRIIGVSGLGSEAALGKAGKAAVRAFLKKPFSVESLLLKLNEIFAEKK
jgi:PAS domain S-box-containing protein